MKQLGKVLNKTSWAQASNTINTNSESVFSAVTMLENAAFKHKGYFLTSEEVAQLYPSAEEGSQAFVYNPSNPSTAPYDIYQMIGGTWADTGLNGGCVSVDLTKKQDTLVGYSESVSGGKATQVAIQGDTIALSGKVSLGNVDNMESAILMSSSQAGAAIAKANTLEQSMNAIKSPIKPIQLNSQGKLELNIGKGLYIEDGKLCTTGASGGGGGGTTLSEGDGIRIYNDTINVEYDIDTLRVNSCGGLTVNYGEGLTIKNGKLSAQASVNAGNGLVKKGEKLQVSVGTGLLVADDVYVNMGKGLATDNENKVNVNLDEQTLTTDSSGKVIVNKCSLIGNGLKQESSKLAVNYGAGLALSNKAIVVNYGTGLSIQDGKLVSTVQGGKTYVAGDAIGFVGNNINVRYDGVTISTKNTTDRSLHVMLGSGLKQGTSGIDVAVGSGLAIGEDNKLYSTVSSGKTYTAGDGIDISGNKIAVKYCDGLQIANGSLFIATGDGLHIKDSRLAINPGFGLGFTTDGMLKLKLHGKSGLQTTSAGLGVNAGVALSTSDGKLNVQYGTGLGKSTDNKLQVLLGTGLAVEGNYIRVEEAVYDSIEEANAGVDRAHEVVTKLQTALGGKQNTLTLATGLEWGKTNMIQVKMNAPLNYDNCGRLKLNHDSTLTVSDGKLGVDLYDVMDSGWGLFIKNTGLAVNVGRGLKIDSCQVVVDYGTGMSENNNKIYVDTSKIAGAGIDLDSAYKTLTIGTKAAQTLAGTGLVAEGQKMKVKYGSGLTTNSCGRLIVDAANLTVGKANRADVAHGITIHQEVLPHGGGSYAWYNVYHSVIYSQGDAIILSLRHSYHYLQTDSITVAINVGYGKATITQMNATTGAGVYDKIRVRWLDNQKVYVDVRILSNYANTDAHYVQGIGSGTFTPPTPTSDDTGTICKLSIHQGGFYAPKVWADTFEGNLTGTASRATEDGCGRVIVDTYATRHETKLATMGGLHFCDGVGVNFDQITLSTDQNGQAAVHYGNGLTTSNNKLAVNYGTALGISNSRIYVKYSTSYLTTDSAGYLTIDLNNLKKALGIL